ncbi:MAG TPA: UDP-glucose 4-epimerase GalE [Tenericutes bacterium]|nr:UDP-glucose 4-epimerase GalE [Mycoplasmatota bacterium]
MNILVTGGLGYIGSHTCVELLNSNYNVVVIDNLYNSNTKTIENIKKITKKDLKFYLGDVKDKLLLQQIFNENKIDAVIHFAAYKAVGESVAKPLMYYDNNISSLITLLTVMDEYNCKKIVFSSSATVYKETKKLPLKENSDKFAYNPYGNTKLFGEKILEDLYNSDNNYSIAILRYFNPIGSHESGLIGENIFDIPNNLMPYILKVANKELDYLTIYGDNYETHDGTGIRDYIHVVDLAKGHINALEYIKDNTVIDYFNLGTGIGYSVLDVVKTFIKVNNIDIPYKIGKRRDGDIAVNYSDPSYAREKIGFYTTKNLEDMCKDSYKYVLVNKINN